MISTVSSTPSASMSAPVQLPTAAEHHSVAAVAEEADAGDHVGDHPHRLGTAGDAHAQVDEGSGAHRDQHVGAQAGGALPVLAFGADQRAKHEGGQQADHGVGEGAGLEGFNEAHGPSLPGGGDSRSTPCVDIQMCRKRLNPLRPLLRGQSVSSTRSPISSRWRLSSSSA
ncbi:hypothetical protein G6F32_014438 [Rhizopus arrhizus]|nr:hypothetical protein G6F32_014438 [Rhizopus arrhizus]